MPPKAQQDVVKRRRHPAFGAMKGTFTIAAGVDLTAPTTVEPVEYLDEKQTRGRRRLVQKRVERPMPLSPRIRELQIAMDRYGSASGDFFTRIHFLGNEIVRGVAQYLGEGSEVIGVPPEGEWEPERGDYRDAKFSDYGKVILIEPVQMGLAIKIPHSRDAGSLWVRLLLTLRPKADGISVWIGDTCCGTGFDASRLRELEPIYECILNCAKNIFEEPLNEAGKLRQNSIGFVDLKQVG